MARNKGLLNIAANFEPQSAEPFDARTRIPTKAELLLADTWESIDGNNYLYKGIPVSVYNDTPENNGLYQLVGDNFTLEASWSKVGTENSNSNYTLSFDNDDLVNNTITITHNLNSRVNVTLYNNNNKVILPDEVTHSDNNTLVVDLKSFSPISGEYTAYISK